MKVYMQMFKYSFKLIPKITMSLLIMMVSVTIYRLFFLGDEVSLFSKNNTTIAKIIFSELFMLSLILAYYRTFIIISPYFNVSFLQMIPEIRKKALKFTVLNLGLLFVWAIFILGYRNFHALFTFTISSLWLFSTMITLASCKVPVYGSNRFWVFKLMFALFSFVVPLLSTKEPAKHPTIYTTLISLFLIVVLYQIFNFVRNYMNFRQKEDFSTKGFGLKMNSLQNIIDNFYVKKSLKLLKKISNRSYKERNEKLIQLTLFGNIFFTPLFFIGIMIGFGYIHILNEFGIEKSIVGIILYFTILLFGISSKMFKQKNKLCFLYVAGSLNREDFEKQVLKSYIKYFLKSLFIILIPLITVFIVYKIFFEQIDFIPILVSILIVSSVQIAFIYYFWTVMLRNKDYDKLKQPVARIAK